MSNFIFSESLEISVIEYRFIQLYEMLEKANLNYVFPALVFNESFWQNPQEKRLSIIFHNQLEWLEDSPIHKSFFYKDFSFLDLLKSVKLTIQSFKKLDLEAIINLFKTKNKFSITEFASFGDLEKSPVKFLNDIFYSKVESLSDLNNPLNSYDILAKISAIKFYTSFYEKKEINGFIFSICNSINYWETFFKSLEVIDQKQNKDVFKNLNFFFTDTSSYLLDILFNEIEKYPTIYKLYNNDQIKFETLDLNNFELNIKLDYIGSIYGFSNQPAEFLSIYEDTVYKTLGRLTLVNRTDVETALQKAIDLQSPFKFSSSISTKDLGDLDFEITHDKYTNTQIIDLIKNSYGFIENIYIRFSQVILTFLIKSILQLNKDGYIEIWDYSENDKSLESLSFERKEDKNLLIPINYNLYGNILKSLNDVEIEYQTKNLQEILSTQLTKENDQFIFLDSLYKYTKNNLEFQRSIFDINNFNVKQDLLKINKSLGKYSLLKSKKIMLFGVPTSLYTKGFKVFKNKVLENPNLNKILTEESLQLQNYKSYINEALASLSNNFLNKISNEKNAVLISKDIKSTQNKEFFKILEESGLNIDKVMEVINREWNDLVLFTNKNANYQLLEIVKK